MYFIFSFVYKWSFYDNVYHHRRRNHYIQLKLYENKLRLKQIKHHTLKHHFPDCEIYPVEPASCNDTQISLQNRTRTRLKNHTSTICDALEVEIPGEITFPINLQNCAAGLSVTDEEVCQAMKYLYEEFNIKAEPSGCVSLAAILSNKIQIEGKNVLVTISGGNVDDEAFFKYIK